MFRLSTNSSYINIFFQNKHDYDMAPKNSGYKDKLVYKNIDETLDVRDNKENFMVQPTIQYARRN